MNRWFVEVRRVERVTPHVVRVTFGGDLSEFTSVAPDQQVKLFFARPGLDVTEVPAPHAGGDVMTWYQSYLAIPEERRPWMRSYSVRRHHIDRNEIEIDFVLHGEDDHGADSGGPASRWAACAREGDVLALVGPAVSHLRTPGPHDWTLLAGDETALPAMSALLAAMPAGERVIAFIEVADAAEEQALPTAADATVSWLHRGDAPPGRSTALVGAIRAADLPTGPVYAWVAGEASAVRAVRRHLVNDRGIDKRQIAFTGYWRLHMTQDADPTPDDLADHAEQVDPPERRSA